MEETYAGTKPLDRPGGERWLLVGSHGRLNPARLICICVLYLYLCICIRWCTKSVARISPAAPRPEPMLNVDKQVGQVQGRGGVSRVHVDLLGGVKQPDHKKDWSSFVGLPRHPRVDGRHDKLLPGLCLK